MMSICPNCKITIKKENLFLHYKKKHKSYPRKLVSLIFKHLNLEISSNQYDIFPDSEPNQIHLEKTKFNLKNLSIYVLLKQINKANYKEQITEYENIIGDYEAPKNSIEIENLLLELKKAYDEIPSKIEYEKNRINCSFCKLEINKNSMFSHIQSKHIDREREDIIVALKESDIIIGKGIRKWLKNKDSIHSAQIKNKIDERYSQIRENIEILKSRPFFKKDQTYEKTILKLDSNLRKLLYPEVELKLLSKYKSILESIEKELPDKITYIKNYCTTVYVSWHDLYFDKKKLKIHPSKGFYPPIELDGSLKILNEIKENYFQRLYSDDVYKLRFTEGILNQTVSPDLFRIKRLINHRVKQITPGSKSKLTDIRERSGDQILKQIESGEIKNNFLRIPAKFLNKNDRAIALSENNNNSLEECLLFVFNRNHKHFVLWENLNSNRAGYLFIVSNSNFKAELNKIILVINNGSVRKKVFCNKG